MCPRALEWSVYAHQRTYHCKMCSVILHQLELAFNHLLKSFLILGHNDIVLMKLPLTLWKLEKLIGSSKEERRSACLWLSLHFAKMFIFDFVKLICQVILSTSGKCSATYVFTQCKVHCILCSYGYLTFQKMKETSLFSLNNKWKTLGK